MRTIVLSILLASAAASLNAQQWEFGAVGGGGVFSSVPVNAPGLPSASAGFAPGAVAGAYLGNTLYRNLSGEIHYEYMQNDLRLSSGGQSAEFAGSAHLFHYDLIYHTSRKESQVQFFGALGGGMKLFRASGAPEAYQPLSQYGYFTQAHVIKPMVSVGGGLTYRLSPHLFLRAEVRDFITPFPTQVLTPPQGVKYGRILNDIVPLVGLSYIY